MNILMLNTGYGTYVAASKVKVITNLEPARVKKEIARLRECENSSWLIDSTKHKAVKAVIILDDGTHVLCSITPETLVKRLSNLTGGSNE